MTGSALSLLWCIPFAGLLLSLALGPILAEKLWHAHYGKIAGTWTILFLVPFLFVFGPSETVHQLSHTLLSEYLPFIIILFALYTISGGIVVRGTLIGTPKLNTGLIAVGAMLASAMGTTGASMLLIRPLLRANEKRRHRAHVVVFFIILVGNIGGALTPLGDPPLFIGFLNGVDFFWPARVLALPTLAIASVLLAIFYALDHWYWRREPVAPPASFEPLTIDGAFNFALIAGVVGAVLMSGVWKPGIAFDLAGAHLELQDTFRDLALLALALTSLALTPRALRESNAFSLSPMAEVAKLFAGIFVTVIPVIAVLQASPPPALAAGEAHPVTYFWMTGVLSAFLDNAPTYLVFFNLAGGDPVALMGPLKSILAAISAGAVYFGALTYVGNAPNFMVKTIAENRGVAMPSFFGYLAYAAVLLLPLFAAMLWIAL